LFENRIKEVTASRRVLLKERKSLQELQILAAVAKKIATFSVKDRRGHFFENKGKSKKTKRLQGQVGSFFFIFEKIMFAPQLIQLVLSAAVSYERWMRRVNLFFKNENPRRSSSSVAG
jgi:hypothetical protein